MFNCRLPYFLNFKQVQVFCFSRELVNRILSSDLHKAIKSVDLIKEIQLFLKGYCGLDTAP